MKDKPKLGRGLGDVSSYFLSRTHDEEEPTKALSAVKATRSVGVCHTGSVLVQSCILANLALETAKRRHPVTMWDFSASDDAGVSAMMQSVVSLDESNPGTVCVKLYGLPEITIFAENAESKPAEDTDDGYHLVNTPGSLDFILGKEGLSDYIFITKTDEKSLLKTYAFIKAACSKDSAPKVHVVFDAESDTDEGAILQRFSAFVDTRLGCTINYLGRFIQDEPMLESMKEAKPLVLRQGFSEARECITGICSRFLDQGMDGGIDQ